MARRSDHSREELHDMAVRAAERIVESEGGAGLSTRKVAAEIGYTVGTLYLVFENLDDLILQINARTLDRLHERLSETLEACRQPRRCIEAMAHAYIDYAFRHRNRWQLVFEYVHAGDSPLPGAYQARIQRTFDLVEQQLAQLGGARATRKTALAARALWCGVHGVCGLALSGKLEATGAKSARGVTDMLVENFLNGLLAKQK